MDDMTTILVVDDNPVDQRIVGRCIEEHGAATIFATNGREALDVVDQDRPDAVVTDLQMPEMDGLGLVRKMRQFFPCTPVILMTAFGSEQVAVEALQAGALSYLSKENLRQELGGALRIAFSSIDELRHRERARECLQDFEARFVLAYQPEAPQSLVNYLQAGLEQLNFFDQNDLLQVSTALIEAITNAVDHGNLELNSELRETGNRYRELAQERINLPPYNSRRVEVRSRITSDRVVFTIRDEGPGFDPSSLPDPTNSENLLKAGGRGVALINNFMDEVTFNATGNEITMTKFRKTNR